MKEDRLGDVARDHAGGCEHGGGNSSRTSCSARCGQHNGEQAPGGKDGKQAQSQPGLLEDSLCHVLFMRGEVEKRWKKGHQHGKEQRDDREERDRDVRRLSGTYESTCLETPGQHSHAVPKWRLPCSIRGSKQELRLRDAEGAGKRRDKGHKVDNGHLLTKKDEAQKGGCNDVDAGECCHIARCSSNKYCPNGQHPVQVFEDRSCQHPLDVPTRRALHTLVPNVQSVRLACHSAASCQKIPIRPVHALNDLACDHFTSH